MQPLIRLRSLASQLKLHELQCLMQELIATYNANQVLSVIFNHFVLTYNRNSKHETDVFQIIQRISTILNARTKNKCNHNKVNSNNEQVRTKMVVDSIPYDLIGECASFLDLQMQQENIHRVQFTCNLTNVNYRQ
eukprot:891243_1